MKLEKVDHICIAVKNLEEAERYFSRVFDLEPDDRYIEEKEKIEVVRYYIGEAGLELVASTDPEGDVAKFIERNGEGVFLLSLKVPKVEEAMDELRKKGVPLTDEVPRQWRQSKYTFIKPKAMFGVLLELID
ncbi:MAG: VOC family protein [Dethiobacteria bacterium]|jgi:methylmalonyl-CoA/ethylmalonyl-CoA epimerase